MCSKNDHEDKILLDENNVQSESSSPSNIPHQQIDLPKNTIPLDNQVAGHFYNENHEFGILKHATSGDILKPIVDKRSQREYNFYSQVFSVENDNDKTIVSLRQLIPQFNGIYQDEVSKCRYLRISNATHGMLNPSILDVKIGVKTYDPQASEEKIKSEMEKYIYATELGFRILGMRMYQKERKAYVIRDKDYGKKITPQDVIKELLQFVSNDLSLTKFYCEKLDEIKEWFEKKNISKWILISSSLLFVHNNMSDNHNHVNNEAQSFRADIKLIDFAHVFPNSGSEHGLLDHNYIFGLNKLDEYFHQVFKILSSINIKS